MGLLLVYRNTTNFCILILYPAPLLNALISPNNFREKSSGSSMYNVMLSANRDSSTSLVLIWMRLLLFFTWLHWLDFQDCGECGSMSGLPCLVPYLRSRASSVSPLKLMLAIGSFAKRVRTTKLVSRYISEKMVPCVTVDMWCSLKGSKFRRLLC